MKKSKIFACGLCTLLLLTAPFTSCANGNADETTENTSTTGGGNSGGGTQGGNNSGTTGSASDLQAKITAAKEGSSITLSKATIKAGDFITINKALTVDGNDIDGLTIKVDSKVSSNVTLKNFKNATIKVFTPSVTSSIRSARSAEGEITPPGPGTEDEATSLKKLDDDVVPLYLEGCTIEKLEAEKDFALYLGSGDDKSVIEELSLKEGVEDFTLIEFDEKDTATEDKSKIEKLNIEDDGIEKINLIGGTFGDVDFADNFAGEIDFKYDKEFEDQFEKTDFMDEDFIKEKDIAIADNIAATGKSGVYKIEIKKDDFDYLNGCVSVVFLKDEQIAMLKPTNGMPAAANKYAFCTPELPLYAMSVAGDFGIELGKTGLSTVYGSESTIFKPVWNKGVCYFKTVAFETYPVYSKEAVIADVGDKTVTYYVDMNAVKKSDLIIGANTLSSGPVGGPGDKLSDIDLTGYKAYFAVDVNKMFTEFNADPDNIAAGEAFDKQSNDAYQRFADGLPLPDGTGFTKNPYLTTEALKYANAFGMDGLGIDIPVYDSVQFESGMPYFFFFAMEEADAYPAGAATATEASVKVENLEYLDVYYFDAEGKKKSEDAVKVLVKNINPYTDDFDYFTDDKLTEIVYGKIEGEKPKVLYARPSVEIEVWEINGNEMLLRGERIACIDDGEIYKTIDPETNKLSDKVSINELAATAKAGDKVYVTYKKS